MRIPEHDYGVLQLSIEEALCARSLQPVHSMTGKVIQLYETMLVRHGVMLVGPTGGGKTTVYLVLADALLALHQTEGCETNPFYQPVTTYVLNPKSVSMGELYGEANPLTLEWRDGLMALCVRAASNDQTDVHKWVVCDGPVDALWIENMNTVLDDNKMLCLANSERIKLTSSIRMVFEVRCKDLLIMFFYFYCTTSLHTHSLCLCRSGSGFSRRLSSYGQSLWDGLHRPRGAEVDAVRADVAHRPLGQGQNFTPQNTHTHGIC